jgi:dihydrofolate reductase
MRSIHCQSFVSLDGVINHMERWHFDYIDAEADAITLDQIISSDALLMGRRTYEVYAGVWPGREGAYPDRVNSILKYVVSSALVKPAWNNTRVIADDPVGAVRALKQQDGGRILMHGYGTLAKTLMAEGLLDELQLWVHPVLAGVGAGDDLLLQPGLNRVLRLADTTTLGSGVVISTYRNPTTDEDAA